MIAGRLGQALRLVDHQHRRVAERAQGVAGRQRGGGPKARLVHLDVEVEEDRSLPRQDVLHQGRLADLTRAEDDADLVAGQDVLSAPVLPAS